MTDTPNETLVEFGERKRKERDEQALVAFNACDVLCVRKNNKIPQLNCKFWNRGFIVAVTRNSARRLQHLRDDKRTQQFLAFCRRQHRV
jgi:hypothetical protein